MGEHLLRVYPRITVYAEYLRLYGSSYRRQMADQVRQHKLCSEHFSR